MPPRKKKPAAETETAKPVAAAPKQKRIVMKRVMQMENGCTQIDQIYDVVKDPAPIGYEMSEEMAKHALDNEYGKLVK